MILIDCNILIYSADQEFSYLRKLFQERDTFVSAISKLEVLGYHKITPKQDIYFDAIFKVPENVPMVHKEEKLSSCFFECFVTSCEKKRKKS